MAVRWPWGAIIALVLCVGISVKTEASEAFVVENSYLFAGPDYDFPRVERLRRGVNIDVIGCIDSYQWCDVITFDERGWVPGDQIEFYIDGNRERIGTVAPLIGLLIIEFSLNDYWSEHYRERQWYHSRDRWRRPEWDRPAHSLETSQPTILPPRQNDHKHHEQIGNNNENRNHRPRFDQQQQLDQPEPTPHRHRSNDSGTENDERTPRLNSRNGNTDSERSTSGHRQHQKICRPGAVCE